MIVGGPGSRGDTYEDLFVDEQSRDGYSEADTFRRFDRGQARRNHSGQKKARVAGGQIRTQRAQRFSQERSRMYSESGGGNRAASPSINGRQWP